MNELVNQKYIHFSFYPPRSQLYPLSPIGIGTPDSESLYSYIVRLSWEHTVKPSCMIQFLQEYCVKAGIQTRNSNPHCGEISSSPKLAPILVSALEALTGQSDLSLLTLLPLLPFFPTKGRGTAHRRWCPLCFEEMSAHGKIYSKLPWEIAAVEACPIHRIRLVGACPSCNGFDGHRSQSHTYSRIGFCKKCGEWLGVSNKAIIIQHASKNEINVSVCISEWIADCSHSTNWNTSNLAKSLEVVCRANFGGEQTKLADALSVGKSTLSPWALGKKPPLIRHIVNISLLTGNPISDLYSAEIKVLPLLMRSLVVRYPREKKRRKTNFSLIREEINSITEVNLPKSFKALAKKYDVDPATLGRHLPEEVKSLKLLLKTRQINRLQTQEKEDKEFSQKTFSEMERLSRHEFLEIIKTHRGRVSWQRINKMWEEYKNLIMGGARK